MFAIYIALALGAQDICLSDLNRFPGKHEARSTWKFASAHLGWLCGPAEFEVPHAKRVEWLLATAPRYNAWWLLDEAHTPTHGSSLAFRRACLWELRLIIGHDKYARGEMPCPVELRFFRWYY